MRIESKSRANYSFIILLFILIFFGLMVYAGFLWTTAQGDPAKVKKAQDMIKQAIIGMIIVFAAYAISAFVISSIEKATYQAATPPAEITTTP